MSHEDHLIEADEQIDRLEDEIDRTRMILMRATGNSNDQYSLPRLAEYAEKTILDLRNAFKEVAGREPLL